MDIGTPHIAGYTLEGKLRGTQIIYDALCEKLAVTPVQFMTTLLPINTYLWSNLKADPDKLTTFYDIKQDDASLRNKMTHGQVSGIDFDALRREYRLPFGGSGIGAAGYAFDCESAARLSVVSKT